MLLLTRLLRISLKALKLIVLLALTRSLGNHGAAQLVFGLENLRDAGVALLKNKLRRS